MNVNKQRESNNMDLVNRARTQLEQPVLDLRDADEASLAAPWRPIHYLGSKLRVLDTVQEAVDQVCSKGEPVCDLFAGSGTVSAWLARSRPVTAVDIQEYSRVICGALLSSDKQSVGDIEPQLREMLAAAERHGVIHAARPLIELENTLLDQARSGDPEPLATLLEAGSLMTVELEEAKSSVHKAMATCWRRINALPANRLLSTMALRHFGGVYFSFRQAAEIDVLLELAHGHHGALRDVLVAAVLGTASEVVNTVGKQFAQPIRPRDKKGNVKKALYAQAARDRYKPVPETFLNVLKRISQAHVANLEHKAIRSDYSDYLSSSNFKEAAVYADPPYTRDHYSRFYHVLETLALRDDPQISTNTAHGRTVPSRGVYRLNRHQSPFCIRSQAPDAFAALFSKVSSKGVPLVLSYSPYSSEKNAHPRVMTIDQIRESALTYFGRVEVNSVGEFFHSRLNRTDLNKEVSFDAEYLFICR